MMNTDETRHFKVAAIAGALAIVLASMQLPSISVASEKTLPSRTYAASFQENPGSFSELIKLVKPAVVSVSTTANASIPTGTQQFQFNGPGMSGRGPSDEFFQRFFGNRPQSPEGDQNYETKGVGSGFIISDDGYIVTNHHVIDDATEIEIILEDGSSFKAVVKGTDPKTDLALLKIDSDKLLPYVNFGDSDNADVGDWVVAVGNQFGLGSSVTAGIVSARGRDIQSGPFDDFLQIDAPINRGNSGGPLFDTQGHVIGINTAIYSPSGGNVGIGFAIPSNMAEDVVAQLKVNGEVTRGWLGVQIQAVTQEVADSLGLEKAQGVIVASVVKNSPASASGIKPGDIITALDDKPVDDIKDLTKLVAGISVGSGVVLKLQRDGGTQLIEVIIGSMPGEEVELAQVEDGSAADESELGLQLASLTPENRKQFKLAENSSGVLVAGVKTSSPASKAGIRPGFVINMVGQKPVASPGDFIKRVRHAAENKQSAVLLRVEYRGENRFVTVKLATA